MSFFSKLFSSSSEAPKNNEEASVESPMVKEQDFVDNTPPGGESKKDDDIVTYNYGIGMPIDAIYVYIERDWSAKGYEQGSINSDVSFMNQQVEIIKEGLSRRLEMTTLKYNKLINELNNEINNLTEMGLLGSVSHVNTQISTYREHIEKIVEMTKKLKEEDPSLMSMIESYKLGFRQAVELKIRERTNNKND